MRSFHPTFFFVRRLVLLSSFLCFFYPRPLLLPSCDAAAAAAVDRTSSSSSMPSTAANDIPGSSYADEASSDDERAIDRMMASFFVIDSCYPFGDCMDMGIEDAVAFTYRYQCDLDSITMAYNASLTTIETALQSTKIDRPSMLAFAHINPCRYADADVRREAGERFVRKAYNSYVLADMATYLLYASRVAYNDVIFRTRDIQSFLRGRPQRPATVVSNPEYAYLSTAHEAVLAFDADADDRQRAHSASSSSSVRTRRQRRYSAASRYSDHNQCYRRDDCIDRLNHRAGVVLNATHESLISFGDQTIDTLRSIEVLLNMSAPTDVPIVPPVPTWTPCPASSRRSPPTDPYDVKVETSRLLADSAYRMYSTTRRYLVPIADRLARIATLLGSGAPKVFLSPG